MLYGYARVSTKGQAKDGNSIEMQEKALREAGVTEIYTDAFTGTKTDRPEFSKLITKIKKGDTLTVTKLDRFARSMSEGSKLVSELIDRGVRVYILNIGVMDNTPSSKLIRNIFFAFAEFERDMIVERTQEGKAIAKQNSDFKEGRPSKFGRKQVVHALEMLGTHSYKQVEELTGISKSTLIRAKRKRKGENNYASKT
jgi:DNA invertase Pin-like site-specific DNA recombinase